METKDRTTTLMAAYKMKYFPNSSFVGPYEKANVIIGMLEEQWLWQHRDLIHGYVVDMSTPRFFHEFIYGLPKVKKIMISDLDNAVVEKLGHESLVDVIGDFCANPAPMPAQSLDTILSVSIMEHVEDPFALMRNLAEFLRPGGNLFVWTPFAYTDGHMGPYGPDYWRFGRDAHLLLGKKAGLETLETGQFIDVGSQYVEVLGKDMSAKSWNRGIPVANWSIHHKKHGK